VFGFSAFGGEYMHSNEKSSVKREGNSNVNWRVIAQLKVIFFASILLENAC